ncbi:hypothetical protein GWR56_10330 [Mucilaginibacter sp. 14171R-50]|uniref:hypothetical protein n=1 Tax=Mucilaginibacter sp. 14171R-50 TaxID=2703789 RepID=UPI00138D3623|nr:hypothetical protein [Mucilaginibacter sp. 14171R-50]QHS55909.1 hypothetical protein GWR56_10330 [Mucilaginibacter sp. 14171R-50]
MKRIDLFDNHPVYSVLGYQVIVGLIQLLTDEGLLNSKERNGWYINFMDFRNSAVMLYTDLSNSQKTELIDYLRYKAYLDGSYNSI